MKKLTASSGIALYEEGNKVYVTKSGAGATATILFVTGLLAFLLLINGILQLTTFKDQVPGASKLGYILLGLGLLFAIIFWQVRAYQNKAKAAPPETLQHVCIFDFETNNLLTGQQQVISPINQAYLTRKMQLTSSSPELLVCWNGGSLSLVKGNPFSGGIGDIEKVLVAKGVRKR